LAKQRKHGHGLGLPHRVLAIRRLGLDARLDLIELRDPLQSLRSEPRCLLCLGDFEEASSAMRPASNFDDASAAVQRAVTAVRVSLQKPVKSRK
jgi:hypothetical protein